jgi:hypothetical protein
LYVLGVTESVNSHFVSSHVLSSFRPENLHSVYGILERRPCAFTVNLSMGTAKKLVVFCVESIDFCVQIQPLKPRIL